MLVPIDPLGNQVRRAPADAGPNRTSIALGGEAPHRTVGKVKLEASPHEHSERAVPRTLVLEGRPQAPAQDGEGSVGFGWPVACDRPLADLSVYAQGIEAVTYALGPPAVQRPAVLDKARGKALVIEVAELAELAQACADRLVRHVAASEMAAHLGAGAISLGQMTVGQPQGALEGPGASLLSVTRQLGRRWSGRAPVGRPG